MISEFAEKIEALKVSVDAKVGGFLKLGTTKENTVPAGLRVVLLKPFLTTICLRVVSMVNVGVVGNSNILLTYD